VCKILIINEIASQEGLEEVPELSLLSSLLSIAGGVELMGQVHVADWIGD
jgi:hypothetical protein